MEPSAAVQLFNKAPQQNIKYLYTGDDDSTTEAHIRQKVGHNVEKLSDIVHMKRSLTTRLYNLRQNGRFPNSSTLSQKVINYLVRCFSYAIAQNKGNQQEIQKAIACIVPHAFGNHTNCHITWCRYKDNPTNYTHKILPYGKDLFSEELKSALTTIFSDYSTETVAEKLAPFSNSQRNEALNSVVRSKNPKIRFYGASGSHDFRVACGVAQTNLRYNYINRTLEALNIEPGYFRTKYNDSMTKKVLKDKNRKTTIKFKKQRAQKHLNSCLDTARKESRESTTYQTGVGLNLNVSAIESSERTRKAILHIQGKAQAMKSHKFEEIENTVSPYTSQLQTKNMSLNDNSYYNFLVFDTETNTTGIAAEICQLAAIDHSGSHIFSQYILPKKDIDARASAVNNLTIKNVNNQRKLFKKESMLNALPLSEAITKFESYIRESIDRTKNYSPKNLS